MDINYTGCLAVSLYGILIQGCRHNGNPHHGLRCSPARWREEKKEETWTPGVKGEAKELAGRRPLCLLLLVRSCVYSAASFALSFPCFPSWRSICITLHLSPLLLSLSLSLFFFAEFELLLRNVFYECGNTSPARQDQSRTLLLAEKDSVFFADVCRKFSFFFFFCILSLKNLEGFLRGNG